MDFRLKSLFKQQTWTFHTASFAAQEEFRQTSA
jgi:hypothetical protein